MFQLEVTFNHVKVVILILQEKYDCGKLKAVNRVTGLIIIKLSRCISPYFLMLHQHRTQSLLQNVIVKRKFSDSRRDYQHWRNCETPLELLKAISLLARVHVNLLLFQVRRVEDREAWRTPLQIA